MAKNKEYTQIAVTKHLDQFRVMLEEAEIEHELGAGDDFGDFIEVEGKFFDFDSEGSLISIRET